MCCMIISKNFFEIFSLVCRPFIYFVFKRGFILWGKQSLALFFSEFIPMCCTHKYYHISLIMHKTFKIICQTILKVDMLKSERIKK